MSQRNLKFQNFFHIFHSITENSVTLAPNTAAANLKEFRNTRQYDSKIRKKLFYKSVVKIIDLC